MSNFLGGSAVECGPSNALKDVGSLVERDYGAQRVSLVTLTHLPDPATEAVPAAVPTSLTSETHAAASDL